MSRRLVVIPEGEWPEAVDASRRRGVWCSRRFFVQAFEVAESPGVVCLSVSRVQRVLGDWRDGVTWDELMQVKRECGYGEAFAVECYPEDRHLVNVANMRHLFVMPERLPFAWRNE